MTSIFVTHDQTEANALADRIAVMEGGVLQQFASQKELKDRPANLFVATFIGEPPMNVFEADGHAWRDDLRYVVAERPGPGVSRVADVPQTVRAAIGRQARAVIGIRPHAVRLGSGPNQARVVSNQWLGDQSHLASDVAGKLMVAVVARTRRGQGRRGGALCDRCLRPPRLRRHHRRRPLARSGGGLMRRDGRARQPSTGTGPSHAPRPPHRHRCRHVGHQGGRLHPRRRAGRPSPRARTPMRRPARARSSRTCCAPGPIAPRRCASSPTSSRICAGRAAALAVTGAGRRHLADRRRTASRSAAACSGSIRAPPDIVRGLHARRPAYAAHYALDRLRAQRLHGIGPARLARRATSPSASPAPPPPSTARTGSISASPASASPIPPEANFTFGNYRTRRYEPSILDGMGIADCRRLLPPIVDGTATAHPLSAAAAAVTGLPEGLPVVLAYLDVVCTALGGGIYDRSGTVGVSVFGSTGMHMRSCRRPATSGSTRAGSGYTMCFPVPGACASMQSNMAATLNIDWFLDIAREAASLRRRHDDARGPACRHGRARARRPARRRALPPLHLRGRRARALPRRRTPARSSSASPPRTSLCRPDARGL